MHIRQPIDVRANTPFPTSANGLCVSAPPLYLTSKNHGSSSEPWVTAKKEPIFFSLIQDNGL